MATVRSRSSSVLALFGLLSIALAGGGCSDGNDKDHDKDDVGLLAEDGTDVNAAETDAEVITSTLVSQSGSGDGLSLATTGDLTPGTLGTKNVGDGAKAIYFPRNCLKVVSDPAAKTVAYTFDECRGPNGIFKITGTITATYARTADTLILDIVGEALKVNRFVVDWSAHAEITADGPNRSMAWKAQLQDRKSTRLNSSH